MSITDAVHASMEEEELALLKLRLSVGLKRFIATNGWRYLSQIFTNYSHIDKALVEETLEKLRQEGQIVYFPGQRNSVMVWLGDGVPLNAGIEPQPPQSAPAEE